MVGLLWLKTLSELAYRVPGSLRGHVVLFNIFSLFYSIYTQESQHITGVQLNTPVLHQPRGHETKSFRSPLGPLLMLTTLLVSEHPKSYLFSYLISVESYGMYRV